MIIFSTEFFLLFYTIYLGVCPMLAISWQLLLQAFVDVTDNDWASYMAT
jgi:hypothetical protein